MYKPKKKEKETYISFNEYDDWIFIQTYNLNLIKRLKKLADEEPDCCYLSEYSDRMVDCEILKSNFSFKVTYPISVERRSQLSKNGKKNIHNLKIVK